MRWLRAAYEVFGGGWLRHHRHGGEWRWIGRELFNGGANKIIECSTCGYVDSV